MQPYMRSPTAKPIHGYGRSDDLMTGAGGAATAKVVPSHCFLISKLRRGRPGPVPPFAGRPNHPDKTLLAGLAGFPVPLLSRRSAQSPPPQCWIRAGLIP